MHAFSPRLTLPVVTKNGQELCPYVFPSGAAPNTVTTLGPLVRPPAGASSYVVILAQQRPSQGTIGGGNGAASHNISTQVGRGGSSRRCRGEFRSTRGQHGCRTLRGDSGQQAPHNMSSQSNAQTQASSAVQNESNSVTSQVQGGKKPRSLADDGVAVLVQGIKYFELSSNGGIQASEWNPKIPGNAGHVQPEGEYELRPSIKNRVQATPTMPLSSPAGCNGAFPRARSIR